ncbi:MAG TPA: carbon storage regulator [Planctomycetaceae bacterium]|nr:carbon storage regulator [Planctomycetaceae bacterium]
MLVLSRKEGERIVIDSGVEGAPIVISVVEIRGGRVRIGIQAPRSVAVRRQELEFELPAGGTTPASFSVPSAVVVEPVRAEVHLASGSC